VEQGVGTGFERKRWTTGADHGRMTLANELGGPADRATNEKPRLRKQPGFPFVRLREFILPNLKVPERACGDDIQIQKPPTAMMLMHSPTGLCSDFYVFKCVRTPATDAP
jgi:hypothetical protein